MEQDVPLFPLNMVLFPGMPLPLHIFEHRYREMIGLCAQQERPFGVLLIREGSEVGPPAQPVDVGTMARIVGVDRLEDGRMNIVTVGTDRFRLVRYSTDKRPYLVGDIELLQEEPTPADAASQLTSDIAALARRYVAMLQTATEQELVPMQLPTQPSELSYVVGAILRIDNEERQQLLEAESAARRLQLEKEILQRENRAIDAFLRQRAKGRLGPFSRN